MSRIDEIVAEIRALRADMDERVFEIARQIGERVTAESSGFETSLIWKAIGERVAMARIEKRLQQIEARCRAPEGR